MNKPNPFFKILAACLSVSASATGAASDFENEASFFAALQGKIFECSFTALPRARFTTTKVESLATDNSIAATYSSVQCLEPGVIRVSFNSGLWLIAFTDDLSGFVIGNMTSMHEYDATSPELIAFKTHPDWKSARVLPEKMELLDSTGNPFATNPAINYTDRIQGFLLPNKGKGMLVRARSRPGGWYASGNHLGTGIQVEKSGYYRSLLRSNLSGFDQRSAHFNYFLLQGGAEPLASAQEQYSAVLVEERYGPTSDPAGKVWNEMGTLRGWARSYKKAPPLHAKAVAHAKENFPTDTARLLQLSVDYAGSLCDSGDFAGAKAQLAAVESLLPKDGSDFLGAYTYYRTLAEAEFGLKAYSSAASHFTTNIQRASESGRKFYGMSGLLGILACQMAQSDIKGANETLQKCLALDEKESQDTGGKDFDRWELAFACVALGNYEAALKHATTANRSGWISYEEYARLACLYLSGQKQESTQLAKAFIGRFGNFDEVNIRRDIDAVTVQLTRTMADPTAPNIKALEQTWADQVQSLRDRPLKNYIFARVMVAVLGKLKSGR